MPDTAPGTITDASGRPARWETITREDYSEIISEAGGLEALTVAACTRPRDENYVLTAWAIRGQDYPLVQNVMDGCARSAYSDCPGQHTYQRFIYDPEMEDDQ